MQQWLIQDFPDGGYHPGPQPIILVILDEFGRYWTEGGASLALPWIRQCIRNSINGLWIGIHHCN